jgi:rubrerythrin
MKQSRRVAKVLITKAGWRCERCGYEWIPKRPDFAPEVCPKCKSPYWMRPRQSAKQERT